MTNDKRTITSSKYGDIIHQGQDWTFIENGMLHAASVECGGIVRIDSGGSASACTVEQNGQICVTAGGHVECVCVASAGLLRVSKGGFASILNTSSGGHIVLSGGFAHHVILSGGQITVSEGQATEVNLAGPNSYLALQDGTYGAEVRIGSDCIARVANGALLEHVTVSSGGTLKLYHQSICRDIMLEPGGRIVATHYSIISGLSSVRDYALKVHDSEINMLVIEG